ncbi:MAG: cytochrome P450 [Chloroflexi bacterium]|nr:cytochrome P450 [Chloroflexota bacterium]
MLGSVPDFWRDPLGTLMAGWRDHGDVVRFRLGGPLVAHLVVRPDGVKQVLQDRHASYRKVPFYNDKMKGLVGEGLLTSEGDFWLRQRRLAQPAFHRQRVGALAPTMTALTLRLLERWEREYAAGQPFDVADEMMRLTLQIVARALLGADVSREARAVGRAATVAIEYTNLRMQWYFDLPDWLPLPRTRRFVHARCYLDRVVYRIIENRRQSGADTGDLLSMLFQVEDAETGERMSDRQLRDEVMTMFLAGHETTAILLSWTWYLLSTNPEAGERLRAELAQVLAGRPPTAADLPRLEYTRMVLEEALRLYPPAYALSRAPIADDEIEGYRIPAQSVVFLSPFVTHRHPEYWAAPERFDPERFRPEHVAGRPRFAYYPFGGGPRQCIGASFAVMEAQLVLATIAQRYRLHVDPNHPIALKPTITLRPRHGIVVSAKRLSG